MYEIERIEKTTGGACVFTLTHFPIDNQQRSVVARIVDAAAGAGASLDIGRSDFTCDENDSDDDTALANQGVDAPSFDSPSLASTTAELDVLDIEDIQPIEAEDNPDDDLEETQDLDLISGTYDPGDALDISTDDFSCDGQVQWFRIDKDTGEKTLIKTVTEPIDGNYSLSITTADIDHYIRAEGRCKDPSTASGFGAPRLLGETSVVPTNTRVYNNTIQVSSDPDDTTTHLSWQGPAEIQISPSKCLSCNGNTKNCNESNARPTYQILNFYRPTNTCTGGPNSGFGFKDKVAAASCNVSQTWKDTAIDIPTLQSYELYRTDSC